jgi:non-specific serine/threonine protein kinase
MGALNPDELADGGHLPNHALQFSENGLTGFPTPLTSLVGRDRELNLAHTLLNRPNVRLLTITGPGGIGKTRLALQLAANVVGDYDDGLLFVELASVREPDLVALTIAQTIGVSESGFRTALDAIAKELRDAHALLVLDNFEHLLDATAVISALLRSCPHLNIIVTSRVLLRLAGEHTIPLPPLALPEINAARSFIDLVGAEAVRLFDDRARAVVPTFTLDETTAPIVAEICRRLDGLPLAIELAASRVRHMPLSLLLERLSHRLPLLTGGSRDHPTRLQTMRSAIAWSHDLLGDSERLLFRRLARYVDGFTLEAAEYVVTGVQASAKQEDNASSDRTHRDDHSAATVNGLSLLIDMSLLQIKEGEHEPRFSMLETIREFAEEQLNAEDETTLMADAHAAWCQALADRCAWALFLPDGDLLFRRLEADHANMRVALTWLDHRENLDALVCLVAGLSDFWYAHSHYWEGRIWFERVLKMSGSGTVNARILIGFARLLSFQGDMNRAEEMLVAGIEAARKDGDAITMSGGLLRRGWNCGRSGAFQEAEALLAAALHEGKRVDDPHIAAAITGMAMANLGLVARWRGDLEAARRWHEQSIEVCREHAYTMGVIRSLSDVGSVARDAGDYVAAAEAYRECLALIGDRGDLRVAGDVLEGAGVIAVMWGQPERAARLLGTSQALRDQFGITIDDPIDHAASEQANSSLRAALGDERFEAAYQTGRTLSVAQAREDVTALTPPDERPVPRRGLFSPRERDVLELLVAGNTNSGIGSALFISSRTVENHVAHIFAKLGVTTRAGAVSSALAGGHVKISSTQSS